MSGQRNFFLSLAFLLVPAVSIIISLLSVFSHSIATKALLFSHFILVANSINFPISALVDDLSVDTIYLFASGPSLSFFPFRTSTSLD